MSKYELPKEKTKEQVNPRVLVLFSKPKVGKTTAAAQLPDSLIFDLEKGTNYVSANSVQINNLDDIKGYGKAIEERKYPYKYLIVDTVSKLEDLVLPYANTLYKKTPMGKNWMGNDVRTLERGAGYLYLRMAFFRTLSYIYTLAPYIILMGHLKDALINKKGTEVSAYELDLTGKIKSILSADVSTIGYMYRKDNQNIINFKTSEEVICGSRSKHLRNKEIIISEYNSDTDEIKTFWDKVYIE